MKKKILLTTIVMLAFGSVAAFSVLAVFTDQHSIDANTFSTGTIVLALSPSTALVTFSSMMPGVTVTNPLVVTNNPGSSALRYAISSTATNTDTKALRDQLVLTIKT